MSPLELIFNDLKPGNILLCQTFSNWNGSEYTTIGEMRIFTVVAIDMWDMASVVGVVDLCRFEFDSLVRPKSPPLELEWLCEWSNNTNVIGLWQSLPSITDVKKAIRTYRASNK